MAIVKGGSKVQAELDKLARGLAKGAMVRVGFLEKATYPDGKPVAMIAAIHNYGAPKAGIPARPYFSDMIAAKSSGWSAVVADGLKKWKSADAAMTVLGEVIAGQLKQSITQFSGVPLMPETVRRKGFDKQLIDHAVMLNAVDYEIKPL